MQWNSLRTCPIVERGHWIRSVVSWESVRPKAKASACGRLCFASVHLWFCSREPRDNGTTASHVILPNYASVHRNSILPNANRRNGQSHEKQFFTNYIIHHIKKNQEHHNSLDAINGTLSLDIIVSSHGHRQLMHKGLVLMFHIVGCFEKNDSWRINPSYCNWRLQ